MPSQEELTAIYAAAPPHIQRVVVIGAYIGTQVDPCELFQLTWQDVDFSRGVLRIHGSKKNKNASSREVSIREALLLFFKQWHADDMVKGIEFLIHFRGRNGRSIGVAWHATLKRAGIERRIRPYDLRHAFGTELVAAGVDVGTVAKLMGHSSPMMLLTHYQYVMDKQKKEAIESLPKFGHVPQKKEMKKPA
ncbi:MAG: site-specific integrase [Desulfovibrio sp.]|nr:site-specific integrase [Desulfovibrio sp.]